jgi:2-dehydro-3-deoxygalactonokinase
MAGDTVLIGVDWGLSQLRAYRIGNNGRVLDSRSSERGLTSVRDGDFDAVLRSVLSGWREAGEDGPPVLLCGMIGSRQGWKEAPYAPCPLRLEAVGPCIVAVESRLGDVRIVGGARTKDDRGHDDIMRGEETQMFGLKEAAGPRIAIAPGTHSKWVRLEGSAIVDFRTYMTGELFALLKKHSTLGWMIPQSGDELFDDAAFEEGVRDAEAAPDMLHGLFNARTSAIFHPGKAPSISSYLSGLLIGYEISGGRALAGTAPIVLVGASRLSKLYQSALSVLGVGTVGMADADAVTAMGLWRIWKAQGGGA